MDFDSTSAAGTDFARRLLGSLEEADLAGYLDLPESEQEACVREFRAIAEERVRGLGSRAGQTDPVGTSGHRQTAAAEEHVCPLEILPLPGPDFGAAEAEAWLRHLFPSYQCLASEPKAWDLCDDLAKMVPACLDVMKGEPVRFVRGTGWPQSDSLGTILKVLGAVLVDSMNSLDCERPAMIDLCMYWSRELLAESGGSERTA